MYAVAYGVFVNDNENHETWYYGEKWGYIDVAVDDSPSPLNGKNTADYSAVAKASENAIPQEMRDELGKCFSNILDNTEESQSAVIVVTFSVRKAVSWGDDLNTIAILQGRSNLVFAENLLMYPTTGEATAIAVFAAAVKAAYNKAVMG